MGFQVGCSGVGLALGFTRGFVDLQRAIRCQQQWLFCMLGRLVCVHIFALPRVPCSGSASGGGGASAGTRRPCLSSTWPTCRSDGMHGVPWKFALLRLREFESVVGCFLAVPSTLEAQPLGPSDTLLVPQGHFGGCTTFPCTVLLRQHACSPQVAQAAWRREVWTWLQFQSSTSASKPLAQQR